MNKRNTKRNLSQKDFKTPEIGEINIWKKNLSKGQKEALKTATLSAKQYDIAIGTARKAAINAKSSTYSMQPKISL